METFNHNKKYFRILNEFSEIEDTIEEFHNNISGGTCTGSTYAYSGSTYNGNGRIYPSSTYTYNGGEYIPYPRPISNNIWVRIKRFLHL